MRWINPENKKHLSLVTWAIKRPYSPSFVRISAPESQFELLVEPGDKVLIGQPVARPVSSRDCFIYAGISGEVSQIGYFSHPLQDQERMVEIHSDGKNEVLPGMGTEKNGWESLSNDEVAEILRDKGVLNLSDLSSLHLLKASLRDGLLIINGCESEPYVTSDHSLMMSHPLEILKGAEILRKFLGASHVSIVLEENKLEIAELIRSKMYFLKWGHFETMVFPSHYPQGAAPVLKESVRQQKSWEGKISVIGVDTAFAVYEAVVLQKPFFERVVTVGGECVADARNVWMPIGASFEAAIRACKGLLREPRKLIMGGPMAGVAQRDWHVPIIASTTAILALPKEVALPGQVTACTRCGDCNDVCPAGISPAMIALAAEKNLFDIAAEWGAESCFECGNCSYVCPSKRPMVELIRYADSRIPVTGPVWDEIDLDRDFLQKKSSHIDKVKV